MKRKKERY